MVLPRYRDGIYFAVGPKRHGMAKDPFLKRTFWSKARWGQGQRNLNLRTCNRGTFREISRDSRNLRFQLRFGEFPINLIAFLQVLSSP
jgi:hypothetical protein